MEGLIKTFLQKNDREKAIIPMKVQDIPNSNPEPSKQWKHHSTRYQTVLQGAATRPELANTQTDWNGTRIPKINPGLYSQMILHQKKKKIYTGEKNASPITVAPPPLKKITHYLSLCTEIATKKGSKT